MPTPDISGYIPRQQTLTSVRLTTYLDCFHKMRERRVGVGSAAAHPRRTLAWKSWQPDKRRNISQRNWDDEEFGGLPPQTMNVIFTDGAYPTDQAIRAMPPNDLSKPSPNLKAIAIAAILSTGLFHLVEAQDAFGGARYQGILFIVNGWRELVREADSRMTAGQFTEAQKLLEKALEAEIPAENRWTVLYMLGFAYSGTQEWDRAEAKLEQSVKVAELVLGPDDPVLWRITTTLASAYQNDSQYEKAERYHRRSLVLQEKVLRPDDPTLARFLVNVASVLNLESKEKEAEPLLRRALTIATRSDGFDRVGRAIIQDNLANSLRTQGQLDEAEGLYKESLGVFRDKFGEMHQFTADAYWGLGFIAKERGQLEAAASLYEKAIQGFGTSFPDRAPFIKQLKSEYEQVKADLSHSRIKE